jgi:hypothetical protein
MAKKEKFVFSQLAENEPVEKVVIKNETKNNSSVQNILMNLQSSSGGSKVTFDCPPEVLEKLKDYGYWEGLSMRDIIIEAVNEFLEAKNFKTRPEKVKNKKKVGRKPKALKLIQQAMG